MEVGGQSRLPKDKPCHVGDGEIRPVRTQWRMVHLVIVRKWMDLERYFQWIGSRDMDSRYGVKRHVCPHSGRWRHQTWIEVG